MSTDHPHPSGYPWAEPVRAGVLHHDRFVEDDPAAEFGERVPVVAVGSNASPAVLARKLGGLLETGLPVEPAVVAGLHIGHSAHVSAPGYVAAAPARGTRPQPVTVSWFDATQLAVLDATEPSYRRIPLPESMPCRRVSGTGRVGPLVAGAQVYESRHGVLAEGGRPVPLRSQAEVFTWLAERLPRELGAALAHDLLVDADLRERVRQALVEADLVVPSGL